MKSITTILTAIGALLMLTACRQDKLDTDTNGNNINPDGTVTITHLNVSLDGAQAATDTRTATLPTPEEDAKVKTRFNTGEVLHLMVANTEADLVSNTYQLSTATLGADGRWTLSPAIRLPQHAPDAFHIQIFYDGKTTAYNKNINNPTASGFYDDNNFHKAATESTCHVNNGTTPWPDNYPWKAIARKDANDNAYFRDNLQCWGGTFFSDLDQTAIGSLAIGASGTLGVKLVHLNALVRITSVINQLGSPVARTELITTTYATPSGSPYTTFTLRGTGETTATASTPTPTPGTLPWQALIGSGDTYAPHSIRLTLADGRQFTVALPLPPGGSLTPTGGFLAKNNRVYAYRLTLMPGSLTATPDTDPGNIAWIPQPDPAVPAGYTPIRTRADLEAIGATGSAMSGNYILMNDIDLTPKDPANPTPEELWTPLGYKTEGVDPNDAEATCRRFFGRFNGNGHTLHGLTIRSDRQRLGLFASLYTATVYNLHFSDAQVEGTKFEESTDRGIGTLTGYALVSTISLCSATDCTVTYSGDASTDPDANSISIGALIGINVGNGDNIHSALSTLIHCHATRCTVTAGNADYAGGLLGWNQSDTRLVACYTRACTVTGGTYAGGLLGGNNKNYRSVLYGCYAATPTLAAGITTKALGALVGINFGANYSTTYPTIVNIIASCYATTATGSPDTPLRLVGINGTDNGTHISNAAYNARIIACVSPLADATLEEPNKTKDGVPIVSITPRGTAQGYLPLLSDPALAQLADLTRHGFGGSNTDATSLTLKMPRVVVNTSAADITVTELDNTYEVTIPPGGIYTENHAWSLHNDIWSTLKDNDKVMPPMIKWE